ncbi:hypothetical protein ABZP36_030248 [Zizania latifolia]
MAGAVAASSTACSSLAPNPTARDPVRRRVPPPPTLVAANRRRYASPLATTVSGLHQARPRDPYLNLALRFAAAAEEEEMAAGGERHGGEALLRPLRLPR